MQSIGEKMIAFNKASFRWLRLAAAGAALGAFLMWALVKLGAVDDWRRIETIILVWAISIYICHKLKNVKPNKI